MAYTFDPINKWIVIPGAETVTDMLDVYSDCMDWVDTQDAMSFGIPVSAFGKKELRTGIYTDIIFVLNDGWKLRYYAGTYQATVIGTVITDDQTAKTSLPGGSNIEVSFEVSTQATVLSSASDVEAIADQVWDELIVDHLDAGSLGELLTKIEKLSKLGFVK